MSPTESSMKGRRVMIDHLVVNAPHRFPRVVLTPPVESASFHPAPPLLSRTSPLSLSNLYDTQGISHSKVRIDSFCCPHERCFDNWEKPPGREEREEKGGRNEEETRLE